MAEGSDPSVSHCVDAITDESDGSHNEVAIYQLHRAWEIRFQDLKSRRHDAGSSFQD